MQIVGLVPARYASSRFPGKPLARIGDRPMIAWVVEGARRSRRLRDVIVATDDPRIEEVCRERAIPVIRTSPDHPTGTDRLAEAARHLPDDVVVNVQGDEPAVEGSVIDAVVEALLADPDAAMATAAHPAGPGAGADPNRVKVVVDLRGRALYFSRSPIPWSPPERGGQVLLQHVGLYAYRRPFLLDYVALPPSRLERAEGLEQLRALEHGHPIAVARVAWRGAPVDVPEDVPRAEARLRELGRL